MENQLGQQGKAGGITSFQQELLHGLVGGVSNGVFDPTLKGFASGFANGFGSEFIAKRFINPQDIGRKIQRDAYANEGLILLPGNPEYRKRFQQELTFQTNIAKVGTASLVAVGGLAPLPEVIDNSLNHNFVPCAAALAVVYAPEILMAIASMSSATAAGLMLQQKIEAYLKGKSNVMDAFPEDFSVQDEGFTPHENKAIIHSTPVTDYEIPTEGFRPWVHDFPTLRGYEIPNDLPDTRILNRDKGQLWTIRPGQEWKEKIIGKAQKTGSRLNPDEPNGHAFRSYREAIILAKREEVYQVMLDRGINRFLPQGRTIKPNRRPDVTYKTKDGRIHQIEVPSKTDKREKLMERMRDTNRRLPEEMRGEFEIKEIIKEIKTDE